MADDRDSFLADLTGQVLGLASEYVNSGGLRVSVKTNLGPEIPVSSAGGGGPGLGELLGIRAGVIVRNRDGEIVQTVGDPAPTDPVKLGIVLVVAAGLGFILVRGVLK